MAQNSTVWWWPTGVTGIGTLGWFLHCQAKIVPTGAPILLAEALEEAQKKEVPLVLDTHTDQKTGQQARAYLRLKEGLTEGMDPYDVRADFFVPSKTEGYGSWVDIVLYAPGWNEEKALKYIDFWEANTAHKHADKTITIYLPSVPKILRSQGPGE